MLCMCLLMAVGSVTSCCHSRWEAVITQDYFLFPMIHHLISEGNPAFCGFYTSNVTKEKSQQRMSHTRRKEPKNSAIPIMADLLKPEEQKSYFLLSLKITQWLLSPLLTQQLYMPEECWDLGTCMILFTFWLFSLKMNRHSYLVTILSCVPWPVQKKLEQTLFTSAVSISVCMRWEWPSAFHVAAGEKQEEEKRV